MLTSKISAKPLIAIMGPTASGKSALALKLALELKGEILSVDSALIYRHLDIGTAKPSLEELQKVPHHLIDILEPEIPFSAGQFCTQALNCIQEIETRSHLPLLVGGTMLYFKSLFYGLSDLPPASAELRHSIEVEAAEYGWAALHDRLKQYDPEAAARINPNDPQRIQRALEIYYLSGQTQSALFQDPKTAAIQHSHRILCLALIPEDRALLHQQIQARFDTMLAKGFIEEVEILKQRPGLHTDLPSMRAVGYRQAWAYLDGEYAYATMREKAIVATRQLAKRQLTWLRSWPGLHCFDPNDQNCLTQIRACIQDFLVNTLPKCG